MDNWILIETLNPNNNTTNNTSRSYKRPRAWGSDEINSSYA